MSQFVIDAYTFDGIHVQQMKGEGDHTNHNAFHITSNGIMTVIGAPRPERLMPRVRCII
jgi:hypothetical protein